MSCPAGSVTDTLGVSSATLCTACAAGQYSNVSTVACAEEPEPELQFDSETVCLDGYDRVNDTVDACRLRVCGCGNGQGTTGIACSSIGANICASCADGYHLNTATKSCDLNVCICQNGVGANGTGCAHSNGTSLHASAKCASCGSSYFLSSATCQACMLCQSGKYTASACATADTI